MPSPQPMSAQTATWGGDARPQQRDGLLNSAGLTLRPGGCCISLCHCEARSLRLRGTKPSHPALRLRFPQSPAGTWLIGSQPSSVMRMGFSYRKPMFSSGQAYWMAQMSISPGW